MITSDFSITNKSVISVETGYPSDKQSKRVNAIKEILQGINLSGSIYYKINDDLTEEFDLSELSEDDQQLVRERLRP